MMPSQKNEDKMKAILSSPTLFAINILKIKPLRWQAEVLEDENKYIIMVCGRRTGKSTVLAMKALWNAFVKPNEEILIISRTFKQAKIIFEKIYSMVMDNEFLKYHATKLNIEEIRFDNGSVIRCLASGYAGETSRGFGATMLIFDEAGLIPDAVYTALLPSVTVYGRQIIYSGTPYGKRGYFYNVYMDYVSKKGRAKENISYYHIKTEDNPLADKEFIEMSKRRMTVAQYKQEFDAEFVEEEGMFFRYDLVQKCMDDYEYILKKSNKENKVYMGVDVARAGTDETAIVLVEENKAGDRKVIWAETHSHYGINEIRDRVSEILGAIDVDAVYIDETGVGGGLVDVLKERYGGIIRGVVFSEKNRERMYSNLKIAMEQGRIKISANDEKIIYQFSSYILRESETGRMRIVKSEGINDDEVDALALTFIDLNKSDAGVVSGIADNGNVVLVDSSEIGEGGNEGRDTDKLIEDIEFFRIFGGYE